jgi:hypothetical protein
MISTELRIIGALSIQPMRVDMLAEWLNMSPNTVRCAVYRLAKKNIILGRNAQNGHGRPHKIYAPNDAFTGAKLAPVGYANRHSKPGSMAGGRQDAVANPGRLEGDNNSWTKEKSTSRGRYRGRFRDARHFYEKNEDFRNE